MVERAAGNWWVENLFRPALIAGMVACLTAPLVLGLQWLIPEWDGTYFVCFAFCASLEGILSERALEKRRITGWAYFGSRSAEALILLLLLKLANYIPLGLNQLLAEAQLWATEPNQFVSGRDLYLGAIFLALWIGSLYVARMVKELDATEIKGPPPPDKTSFEYYLWLTQPSVVRDRQEVFVWLTETILWGGVAMLLASVAIHLAIASAGELAIPILIYFALGIALLSQARFSVVHAGWEAQNMDVQPSIARRWLVWVTLFLLGVALVALVLPTYYSMGPLQALLAFLGMVYGALSFVLSLILFLLTLPLALLFPQMETPAPAPLEPMPFAAPETGAGNASPPWLEILASIVFWLVMLAIVGYAVVRFVRDRVGLPAEGGEEGKTWWRRFLAWLQALWRAWRQEVQVRLTGRRVLRESSRPITTRLARFFFPGRLPPREQLRYFYLSVERRAAQAGQARRLGETPYEYHDVLEERFPEVEPDLDGLTESFVLARYSDRPVHREDAQAVRPLWQRIKAALRRRLLQS
jgi:hypothetical protein